MPETLETPLGAASDRRGPNLHRSRSTSRRSLQRRARSGSPYSPRTTSSKTPMVGSNRLALAAMMRLVHRHPRRDQESHHQRQRGRRTEPPGGDATAPERAPGARPRTPTRSRWPPSAGTGRRSRTCSVCARADSDMTAAGPSPPTISRTAPIRHREGLLPGSLAVQRAQRGEGHRHTKRGRASPAGREAVRTDQRVGVQMPSVGIDSALSRARASSRPVPGRLETTLIVKVRNMVGPNERLTPLVAVATAARVARAASGWPGGRGEPHAVGRAQQPLGAAAGRPVLEVGDRQEGEGEQRQRQRREGQLVPEVGGSTDPIRSRAAGRRRPSLGPRPGARATVSAPPRRGWRRPPSTSTRGRRASPSTRGVRWLVLCSRGERESSGDHREQPGAALHLHQGPRSRDVAIGWRGGVRTPRRDSARCTRA